MNFQDCWWKDGIIRRSWTQYSIHMYQKSECCKWITTLFLKCNRTKARVPSSWSPTHQHSWKTHNCTHSQAHTLAQNALWFEPFNSGSLEFSVSLPHHSCCQKTPLQHTSLASTSHGLYQHAATGNCTVTNGHQLIERTQKPNNTPHQHSYLYTFVLL